MARFWNVILKFHSQSFWNLLKIYLRVGAWFNVVKIIKFLKDHKQIVWNSLRIISYHHFRVRFSGHSVLFYRTVGRHIEVVAIQRFTYMDLKTYRFPKPAARNGPWIVDALSQKRVIVAANWSKGDAPFQVRFNRWYGKEMRPIIAASDVIGSVCAAHPTFSLIILRTMGANLYLQRLKSS